MDKANKPWLAYDTTFEGKPAVMRVDMRELPDKERAALPVLMLLRVQHRKNYALSLTTPFQARSLERLFRRLLRVAQKVGVRIMAVRNWGNAMEFFCYGPDEPALLALSALCEKKRSLVTDYETRVDGKWQVFRKEAYPTAANLQTVKNGEQIEMMVRYGDDIHAPRRINHYCSFTDELARIGFQESARKAGFALGDPFFNPDSDYPHGMCVRHIGSIDKRSLDTWTDKLIAVVEVYNGHYDYWDCQIMRKNRIRRG
ncbi:MAG: ribonuclease E inhibitor RraB [Christensenellales bacterium]|jgi:hypothetical protein